MTTLNDLLLMSSHCDLESHRDESKGPPEWVTIIPDGLVESSNGNFKFDAEASVLVLDGFRDKGRDVVIDYEHQSLNDHNTRKDGQAPAAGWIQDLRYMTRIGLQARIRWVSNGWDSVMSGAYRYLSPVVAIDPATKRVRYLHSVGLTNTPAIKRMPALVQAFDEGILGPPRLPGTGSGTMEPANQSDQQQLDKLFNDLRGLLGLPEEASPSNILTSAIEAIGGKGENGEEVVANRAEFIALKNTLAHSESQFFAMKRELRANKLDTAIKDVERTGKLTASMSVVERDFITAKEDEFEERLQLFKDRMKNQPVVIPQGQWASGNLDDSNGSSRSSIISNAQSEYRRDESLRKMTSAKALINLRLQENDEGRLTDHERQTVGV